MRQASRLLVIAVCGLLALPMSSLAEDHRRAPPPPPAYQNGRHPMPPPYYGGGQGHYKGYRYYPYGGHYVRYGYPYGGQYAYYGYPYYWHDHHHDNDDALWAIGGFVLGAILGSAAQQAGAPPPPTASVQAPPAAPVENCYDDIIHDSSGNPHVERHCYPATKP